MDGMKPVNFSLDKYPGFPGLGEDGEDRVRHLVMAANNASRALRKALKAACQLDGTAANTAIETLFAETQEDFNGLVRSIIDGAGTEVERTWHGILWDRAVHIFDERVLGGLSERDIAAIEKRVIARRNLLAALAKQLRKVMDLPIPSDREKRV